MTKTKPKKSKSSKPREKLSPAMNVAEAGGNFGFIYGDPDFTPGFTPGGIGTLGYASYVQNYFKMVSQAEKLATQSAVYRRILEIMRDNIHGYGFKATVVAEDATLKPYEASVEKVVKNGLFGDVNRVDLKYPKWIFEELMSGESCLPAFTNPVNGSVELGFIPARWITQVQLSARNVLDALTVKTQAGDWVPNRRYKEGGSMKRKGDVETMSVIRYDRNPYLIDVEKSADKNEPVYILDNEGNKILNPDYLQLSGDCFYFRTGNLSGQERGQGDGFALADLVITLEQGIRDFLSRYDAQAALVYDLLIKGATMKDIREKYSRIKLPTGRVPFAHNEKVELKLWSPNIKIDDLTNFIRTLLVLIAGTAGVPEFQMGDGSMTNVATAKEQAPAMYAKFILRRKEFEAQLQMICRFMMERANACGMLYATDEQTKQEGASVKLTEAQLRKINIKIDFLPFERNNMQELAITFKTIVEAAIEAIDASLLSKKAAGQATRAILSTIGIQLDEVAEEAQIKQEQASGTDLSQSSVSPTGQVLRHDDVMKDNQKVAESIISKNGKYQVVSTKGKPLSKPTTKKKAVKRLRQVEHFKNV